MNKKLIKTENDHMLPKEGSPLFTVWKKYSAVMLTIVFFLVVCLSSLSTIRGAAVTALIVLVAVAMCRFQTLRERISLPLLALTLFVIMCGISTFYAQSGKFALQEFLKILFSYCLALSLLAAAPKDRTAGGRWIASILSGAAAILSLVSIDLLSTHILSTPVVSILGLFSTDYSSLEIVEKGTRMLSLVEKPNVYAGIAGIGVLLGLGLAASEPSGRKKAVHLCCLFVNALGFVLAFSMGASGMIALAFVVYLLLESHERRGGLLVLMVETLLLTLFALVPIAATSLEAWTGFQPIPLVCTAIGAALLCLLDSAVGRKLADKLKDKGKLVLTLIAAILVLALLFAFAAYNITGSATLQKGETLRRSVYPAGGDYTVSAQYDGSVTVTVTTQNRQDTMMHTSTRLYRGDLAKASFTVPEDSLVVYLSFFANGETTLEEVALQGNDSTVSVPLGYRLLPEFIANRLQGLFANQNAIQRAVFFEDGMKLFRRSPVIGLGMGAYENGIRSVQSFAYDTKYAHNHYIQVLAETGVIGLLLFAGTLLTAAFALLRARKSETPNLLLPALSATLVFMAGHASVEVIFSVYAFLPFAFGVFALISLCAGDSIPTPWLNRKTRNIIITAITVLLAVFSFFLARNMQAKTATSGSTITFDNLKWAASIDKFEWADYALSYVVNLPDNAPDEMKDQAYIYAEQLAELDSNAIPRYLLEFYLKHNQTENAFAVAEKYVSYVAASSDTWQTTFDLLMRYVQNTAEYRAGVLRIAEKLEDWNAANMGTIELDAVAQAFIETMEDG